MFFRTGRAGHIGIAATIIVLAGVLAFHFITGRQDNKRALAGEPITICYSWTIGLLIGVAYGRGFFAEEGLDVRIKHFSAGREAFAAMLDGKCDLANTSETPLVFKSFERQDFRIVATTRSAENHNQIIARKDSGIVLPRDLRGKRVGVLRATSAHFFLYRYLLEQGLTTENVKLEFADSIPALRTAFLRGTVDAAALWQPHIAQMKTALHARATIFTAPGLVLTTTNIVTQARLTRERPQVIPPFLRALERARVFGLTEPQTAVTTLATVTGAHTKGVDASWFTTHELSLTQPFVHSLEDEARWARDTGLVGPAKIPNYLALLYLDGLASVAPQAVTVLR